MIFSGRNLFEDVFELTLAMSGVYIAGNLPWYLDPVFLPAAFGLLGVIIGGLITAGSTYLLDVRRERREIAKEDWERSQELRTAARLVLSDLFSGSVTVEKTIKDGKYYFLSPDSLGDSSWATYRPVFASALSADGWNDLWIGIRGLSQFKAFRDLAINAGKLELQDKHKELLQTWRADMEAAKEALRPLI